MAHEAGPDVTQRAARVYVHQLDESLGLNTKVKNFIMCLDHEIIMRRASTAK
jgi:hypothetical protein